MEQLVINIKKLKSLILLLILSFFLCSNFTLKSKSNNYSTIINDTIEKDSVYIVNDSVFKLLNSKTIASYYAKKFIGRKTANGEKYDNKALTCAHKKLKFGTKLKVTNLKNNKSVIVRVNDRGPFVKNRSIDLSEKAFTSINNNTNSGIINVKIEQLQEIILKEIN